MTIDTVKVELGARSYDILIGDGVMTRAGAALNGRRAVVITDENVAPLHLDALLSGLGDTPQVGDPIILPPGEHTKSFSHLQELLDTLLSRGIDRRTVLVALGGGVIGDLVGFAAAIALRGIDFVQVPTTLLAQVDSSVGGKTAIDSPHGKNLIGAFHQPIRVLADLAALGTLPPRELRAGYAEVVKYGLINDPGFFDWLDQNGSGLLSGDLSAQRWAVAESCRAKAAIVAADEREAGQRALLNLGHTFGHALETEAGFGADLLHGEAVSIGMVMAFDLSVAMGLCPPTDADHVRRHLSGVGLPVAPPAGRDWPVDALLRHMAKDKKAEGGRLNLILTRGIGGAFVAKDVDVDAVRDTWHLALAA